MAPRFTTYPGSDSLSSCASCYTVEKNPHCPFNVRVDLTCFSLRFPNLKSAASSGASTAETLGRMRDEVKAWLVEHAITPNPGFAECQPQYREPVSLFAALEKDDDGLFPLTDEGSLRKSLFGLDLLTLLSSHGANLAVSELCGHGISACMLMGRSPSYMCIGILPELSDGISCHFTVSFLHCIVSPAFKTHARLLLRS